MGLSPEKMAEFMADEFMDDINNLADYLLKLNERWCKYGQQYQHLLSPGKRAEMAACLNTFNERTKHLA